jgi:hypothetical protein
MREIIFIDLDETAATTDAITFEFTFVDNSTQVITGADFNTSASLIKTLVNPAFAGDNSYRRYSFIDASLMAVRNMDIVFGGISGGIAVLDYKRLGVVPVPAALPMLAGALGMLALLRRRRPTA